MNSGIVSPGDEFFELTFGSMRIGFVQDKQTGLRVVGEVIIGEQRFICPTTIKAGETITPEHLIKVMNDYEAAYRNTQIMNPTKFIGKDEDND